MISLLPSALRGSGMRWLYLWHQPLGSSMLVYAAGFQLPSTICVNRRRREVPGMPGIAKCWISNALNVFLFRSKYQISCFLIRGDVIIHSQ